MSEAAHALDQIPHGAMVLLEPCIPLTADPMIYDLAAFGLDRNLKGLIIGVAHWASPHGSCHRWDPKRRRPRLCRVSEPVHSEVGRAACYRAGQGRFNPCSCG